jgi:integrase
VALLDWLIALREHKSQRDGTPIASRTVRNVASSVRVFFADAAERKVIPRNPTVGWDAERHLPTVEDKECGWRARAGFSLEQVVTFTTDHRIPEDRRVLYALRFLGGPRPGEAANARWRDLNRTKRPLWRLTLESSFNSPMRQEKTTKTGAELNIPVHPVLQRMLEGWQARGWEDFMGRKHEPGDLIFPRDDGKHRLVSGTYKQFVADLDAVGIPRQRQYESRSTFRNLALAAGAMEFHVNMITHPKPKRASDHYTRLEMQWAAMCEAVLAIDPAAWDRAAVAVTPGEVTFGVTVQGTSNEKPPTTLKIVGGKMEREKGFESPVIPVFSRPYDTDEADVKSSTQPSDASGPVETELEGGDSGEPPLPLPSPTSDLFIIAGAIAAEHAARGGAPRSRVEDMLRRAIDQAASLRGEGSMTSPADAGFELEAGRGGRCSECGATRHGTRGDSELAR